MPSAPPPIANPAVISCCWSCLTASPRAPTFSAVGAGVDVCSRVAVNEPDARCAQAVALPIGTGQAPALHPQHLGQRAHARASRADKVRMAGKANPAVINRVLAERISKS